MEHEAQPKPPELWVRDPLQYLDAILQIPWATVRTVWTTDFILETGLSPRKALKVLLPAGNWEALALDADYGYFMSGTSTKTERWERWTYGGDLKRLMELFVSGKRFIVDFPGMDVPTDERDEFASYYHNFDRSCPQAKPHIHGPVAYSKGIGMGPYSVDFDPSHLPNRRCLQLPNGKLLRADKIKELVEEESGGKAEHSYWLNLIGYKSLRDLKTFEDKVRFEMRSMSWAVENWDKVADIISKNVPRVAKPTSFSDEEMEASYLERLREMSGTDRDYDPRQVTGNNKWGWRGRKALPTDRIACDTCSLADVCRAFRQGSVCAVPNTEGDSLRKKFGTRNSSAIIQGLQELTQINVGRIQKALQSEEEGQNDKENPRGLDPELTKLIDKTVTHGEKIAKLVDPRLRPGPAALVQVNNQSSTQGQISHASPQQLTATVVRELEAQGMKREDITPEIINDHINVLSRMSPSGDLNDDEEYDYIEGEIES